MGINELYIFTVHVNNLVVSYISSLYLLCIYLRIWGFFCLFGFLRRFQHCTGHITTGSWKGRGNQYI